MGATQLELRERARPTDKVAEPQEPTFVSAEWRLGRHKWLVSLGRVSNGGQQSAIVWRPRRERCECALVRRTGTLLSRMRSGNRPNWAALYAYAAGYRLRERPRRDFWLEIVTLVIPGFNDSDDELERLTEFIAGVSTIPWHATAFHKDYKMTDPDNTSAETLMRAGEIGGKSGLRYVYAGNLPGEVEDLENTRCPSCRQLLIERYGYLIMGYHLTSSGCCPSCGMRVPGRWARGFEGQITDRPFVPHARSSLFSILRPSA